MARASQTPGHVVESKLGLVVSKPGLLGQRITIARHLRERHNPTTEQHEIRVYSCV